MDCTAATMATGETSARVMVTTATTMAMGKTSARVMVTMGKRIHNELPHLSKLIVRTVQFGPAEPFFPRAKAAAFSHIESAGVADLAHIHREAKLLTCSSLA